MSVIGNPNVVDNSRNLAYSGDDKVVTTRCGYLRRILSFNVRLRGTCLNVPLACRCCLYGLPALRYRRLITEMLLSPWGGVGYLVASVDAIM